ncbi:MAG: NAD(P)-dependent oxidoreductase [Proteobacteria bacterium]|nr:NAD(P)-dependent oxidoreductase [Pseudomonadota bacterium]
MADILITGGAGNFGRTLATALDAQGHALRLLDLPACDFGFADQLQNGRVFRGDIMDPAALAAPLDGVDLIFHLAAILPPASEADRDRTFRINVDGTRTLLQAAQASGAAPGVVFASSISVYGDTSGRAERITPGDPVNPNDIYAASKVEAERVLAESGLPWVNLRISAIAIPEFLDPPEPWPFQPDQRIELVVLDDLVRAMVALVDKKQAFGKTLIIAGGPTWQITGREYVTRWGEIMEIPEDEMSYLDRPGWLNWYDTDESEAQLGYQRTTLDDFWGQLKQAVNEALA